MLGVLSAGTGCPMPASKLQSFQNYFAHRLPQDAYQIWHGMHQMWDLS